MCGVHQNGYSPPYYASIEDCKIMLLQSLDRIQNRCHITIDTSEPDTHLCIMRNCKNLLVHKGGFSTLGALLFNGDNLYLTNNFSVPLDPTHKFFTHIKKYQIV